MPERTRNSKLCLSIRKGLFHSRRNIINAPKNTMTTMVLIKVAKLDETFLSPIFANTAVNPAKNADPTANAFQSSIVEHPSP